MILTMRRLVDFYEIEGHDARVAAEILGAQLCVGAGGKHSISFIYHQLESNVRRLIESGHNITIIAG